jgi:hypothetical protein
MAMGYIKMFYDWVDKAADLTDEEFGSLMRALVSYARDGKSVTPIGGAKYLLTVFRIYVDKEVEAYDEVCEKRREAGIKSGIVRRKAKDEQVLNNANTSEQMLTSINKMNQEKEKEEEKENEKENDIFIYNQEKEPEIDEIKKYITENNLKIDGEEFFDHYSAIGWKIGGNPIVDWRAALRRWARGAKKRTAEAEEAKSESKSSSYSSYDVDDFFQAALNRKYTPPSSAE